MPESDATPAVIYIDLHLVHEVTSPQGFDLLRGKCIGVRRPDRTLATIDHSTPTLPAGEDGQRPYITEQAKRQVQTLRENCREFDIELHDWDSPSRGIVHVMGPELGASQPGMTIVCGDSHTSTHGAFGALAFGIGTTEVGHVLAKQCLLQNKPKSMRVNVEGRLAGNVTAKDLALNIINYLGMNGGTGFVIEYAGEAVRSLDMESRMTLCNLTIEAGARAGMIAPDQTTVEYLRGRAKAPQGEAFDRAQGNGCNWPLIRMPVSTAKSHSTAQPCVRPSLMAPTPECPWPSANRCRRLVMHPSRRPCTTWTSPRASPWRNGR
jgi:3-isopropylmalate/(R)-2-methylmalate dehydratase large subunit